MKLYRVFPYDSNAAQTEKGGALFLSRSNEGRIDNPSLYAILYLSDSPEGAIAETFGRLAIWRPIDFTHPTGTPMTLGTYTLPDDVLLCDLDDVTMLAHLGIQRPSQVVTRNRTLTQQWSRRIFETGRYAGVQWWCYYDPAWRSIAETRAWFSPRAY